LLSELPEGPAKQLLATSYEEELLVGQNIYRELPEPRYAFAALLVEGLLRTYVTSPQGRRMALRYTHPGEIIGLTGMVRGSAPAGADVLIQGSMLRLDLATLRRLAQSEASVSWAVARQLANELAGYSTLRSANLFGSVRVRVARHLLELATRHGEGLAARITQQELADSVGSVREVVARVLVALKDEDIIAREGKQIVILDADRLEGIAEGR